MSSADAPFIRRHPKEPGPLSFWNLRAQGLASVQALSAVHWTDYNLHDPGVTILEQVCYALTGLVYRADFPVADCLTAPDGRIDFAGQALHPAEAAFPCRPATADDYRRLLLDRIDALADAAVEPSPASAAAPPGLWRVELRLAPDHEAHAPMAAQQAMALLRTHRNLGEDFEHQVALVEERWCELDAEIEVGGPRDPADVLAEVYFFCEQRIAAPGRFVPLDSLLRQGASLEEVFTGPPVQRGLLYQPMDAQASQQLFVADLMTGLKSVDGVREVRRLALTVEGDKRAGGDSLPRRGPGWALRLRVPTAQGRAARVRLVRRDSHVEPAADIVHMKYEDLLAGTRTLHMEAGGTAFAGPRPRGVHRDPGTYRPMQDLFPAVYGINAYGLEPGASTRDKALAWQLKAYLVLFDQVMAHSAAQLAHLRELFAVDAGTRQTYWWQMLDDHAVEGIGHSLYTAPTQQIEQRVYWPFDDFYERKGRLMDYLLSLHGESYPQNSLRQFGSGYTPAELEAVLFENKAAVLKDIIGFSRNRAAGFDDSQACWDHLGNESGLQRRVGLLLGFVQTHTRSLAGPLLRRGRELVAAREWRERAGAASGHHPQRPEGLQRLVLDTARPPSLEQVKADLTRIDALRGSHLNEALLRCGAFADRYWLAPEAGGRRRLFVGPDESGAFWSLGDFDSETAAARAAASLRNLMLRLNEQSEGLFVLEYMLLRPVGSSAAHQRLQQQLKLPAGALDLRLSVVFPSWPLRCQDGNFRELAAETVRINAPAHLQTDCLWLDFAAMREFERRCEKWLEARRAWCGQHDSEPVRIRMNHAACELLRTLLAPRQEISG